MQIIARKILMNVAILFDHLAFISTRISGLNDLKILAYDAWGQTSSKGGQTSLEQL